MTAHSARSFAVAFTVVSVLTWPATASMQWLKQPTAGLPRTADGRPNLSGAAPRTRDGRPDLSGLWQAAEKFDSDFKPADALPWAQAEVRQREENPPYDSWAIVCLPAGPMINFTGPFKILQMPDMTAMLYEVTNNFRQIFTDGRALPDDPNPTWQGYSVGRWDGETFVVETTGFNERSRLGRPMLYPHTEALRVTERYRRRDLGHIDLQMTIEDPKAFTRPWTVRTELVLQPDTEMLEYVCNENEKDRQHFVAPSNTGTGNSSDATTLAKYAGAYEVMGPRGTPMILTVTMEDGQLVLDAPGRGHGPAVQQSPTSFVWRGVAIDFIVDDHGEATQLVVHAVEGDFKGTRRSQ